MKNVKLNGRTTAELLIELSEAYGEIVANAIMFAEFKGSWDSVAVYKYGDIVRGTGDPINDRYGSFIYINETPTAGVNVGNSNYWFLLALDGKNGEQGASGRNGRDGTNGRDGNSITSINTISHSTVGDETVTKLRVDIENTEPQEIEVHAQNGQSVTDVVAGAPVEENGYTKTPISFFYNGSDVETVDVVAKNGADGAAEYITIDDVPDTSTNGILTLEQLAILNKSPNNNYIMFHGEKFIPMDIQDSKGYRVYTHHGETNITYKDTTKFLYLMLNVRGWEIRTNYTVPLYRHFLTFNFSSDRTPSIYNASYIHISNRKEPLTLGNIYEEITLIPVLSGYGNSAGLQIKFMVGGTSRLAGIIFNTENEFDTFSTPAVISNFNDTVVPVL